MYVCICNAVTEKEIYKAIAAGATSLKALNHQLGVGAECGACVSCAKSCLSKKKKPATQHPANVFAISKQEVA